MRYDYLIDDSNSKNSHTIIADLIRKGSKVLDIGCSTGFLAKYLRKEKGCFVVGIEQNEIYFDLAQINCDILISENIEGNDIKNFIDNDFDVIVLGDVLEHMYNPWQVLKNLKKYLHPNGIILISLPNIVNWRIRKDVLFGIFRYTDEGILDKTHLRFFDLFSAKKMIQEAGYKIDGFDVTSFKIPKFLCKWYPNLLAYQFIFKISSV